jgi:hypothetical protein
MVAMIVAAMVAAQAPGPRETISVGIDLTLGMSEDSAVRKLTESGYRVRRTVLGSAFKEKGFTSMWIVEDQGDEKEGRSRGVIFFSSGKLTSAMRELLPNGGTDVEFGRQLYFAMRDLEEEGDAHCTIRIDTREVPDFAQKTANLQCGKKTIVIALQKSLNRDETVQLNEELGSP